MLDDDAWMLAARRPAARDCSAGRNVPTTLCSASVVEPACDVVRTRCPLVAASSAARVSSAMRSSPTTISVSGSLSRSIVRPSDAGTPPRAVTSPAHWPRWSS